MAKGQDVYTLNLNSIDHDFKDKGAHSDISVVTSQIETLSQQIQTMSLNMQTLQTSLNQAKQQLQDLQAIVPQEATTENTLADKDYVDTQVENIIDDTTASSTKVYSSEKTQTELDERLPTSGGTMTGALHLKNDSGAQDESDNALLAWTVTDNINTGVPANSTCVGSLQGDTIIRSKTDNLFHYNHTKAKRLKIVDEGHLSYIVGETDMGYKWVNGKEVYRRVDTWSLTTLPVGNSSYTFSSSYWSNIDTLISFSLLRPKTASLLGAYIPTIVRFDPSTKRLDVYGLPTEWSGPFYIIVEYTKN